MRVLTVGNIYPPHHFGGYEQVWQSAVQHLREGGHDVRILCTGYRHPGTPDGDEPGVDRALDWYWCDHDFVRFGLRDRLRTERRNHAALQRHLDELRPDAVAFWSMGGMSHSLIEAVRRRGIPIVLFVHDTWFGYGRSTDQWTRIFVGRPVLAARLAESALRIPARVEYARAGRWVFVSDFVRRKADELGIADVAIAHSGIDPLFLEPGPEREWEGRLLYVGRLHPDKGIQDAVAALAALPDATLTFAGTWDPREESSLAAQIGEAGVGDRVTLLGHRTHEEIADLYRTHDALLFPVRWEEPWGLVPLEAMGCGCPVVATARGGSGEYLRDEENALLVPPERPDALANAVRRLAEDAGLRARLREGGFATAPLHTEPIFNAEVERHLREVARSGAASAERPASGAS